MGLKYIIIVVFSDNRTKFKEMKEMCVSDLSGVKEKKKGRLFLTAQSSWY